MIKALLWGLLAGALFGSGIGVLVFILVLVYE